MDEKPIQHYYPDEVAVCYGCGRNNPKGLQIETHWDGEEGVCRFTPEPHHTAFPGFVYGGLVASLIDGLGIGLGLSQLIDFYRNRRPGKLKRTILALLIFYLSFHLICFIILAPIFPIYWSVGGY